MFLFLLSSPMDLDFGTWSYRSTRNTLCCGNDVRDFFLWLVVNIPKLIFKTGLRYFACQS